MQFDNDIPIPPAVPRKQSPVLNMKVGQSFFSETRPNLTHLSVKSGFKFACRKVSEKNETGYRTWRIA